MSTGYLFRVLRKHILKIILLVVVGVGAAYGFSKEQHPVYASTVSLVINPASPNVAIPYLGAAAQGGPSTLETLAGTYNQYLISDAFAKIVVSKLGLPVPTGAISGSISSALVAGTNFFHITVRWSSAQEAAALANGIAAIFIEQNQTVLQQQTADTAAAQTAAQQQLSAQAQFYRDQVALYQKQLQAVQNDPKLPDAQKVAQVNSLQQTLLPLQDAYTKVLAAMELGPSSSPKASLNTAQVIDPAVSGGKIAPTTSRNVLFGAVAGLTMGLAVTALLEYLDSTVHSSEELEELVGAPLLALVGMIGARREQGYGRSSGVALATSAPQEDGEAGKVDEKLITMLQPMGRSAESFRVLRTMLEFSNVDSPPRTLLVTSTASGEGKTLISANLAVAFAQSGKRVILVDADLHRPGLHREFNLPNQVGLTNLITADAAVARERGIAGFAQEVAGVPGLLVLSSGPLPPSPAELLGSERAGQVYDRLAEAADIVIYDTPPANVLADAFALATRVAGVIVVAQANHAQRSAVRHLGGRLRQVGAVVLGGVLNMVPEGQMEGSYYSYGYYQRAASAESAVQAAR